MVTEARRRANTKYDKLNVRQLKIKLNLNTDKDVIARLKASGNMSGYIKSLVRADIEARPDLFAGEGEGED